MKLLCSNNSPYARKVRVCALELGLEDAVQLVDTSTSDPENGLRSSNPLGKIPVLLLDDGSAIYDSPVICEFLNAQADGALLPAGAAAWHVRTRVALADGAMDAGMAARLETLRTPDLRSDAWIDKQLGTARRALDAFDRAPPHDDVDLATIAIACAIEWLRFRHPDEPWLDARPALAKWHARFGERPSLRDTRPAA